MAVIRSKSEMYTLLKSGALGCTVPQFDSLDDWWESPLSQSPLIQWGVRSKRPGGPFLPFLDAADVPEACLNYQGEYNVSMMIDSCCSVTLMAEVWESDAGLIVYGVENPPLRSNWRRVMPTQGRHYTLTAAKLLLQRHLSPDSLSDLYDLLEKYPRHVVELSATDSCRWSIPGRNAVVWEVRDGLTGDYERNSL